MRFTMPIKYGPHFEFLFYVLYTVMGKYTMY